MAGTRSLYQRTISLSPDDLHFVETPPKHLALECPICYNLLFNPHIVGCCGHHFCEHCIERVKDDDRPCPMCKAEAYTSMRDKGIQRTINQLVIFCPNSAADVKNAVDFSATATQDEVDNPVNCKCEWSGEIGLLESHLNVDDRIGDCQFVVVGCTHGCGHSDMRLRLTKHETTCSQRPYSCDYCGDYQSTVEDVVDRHWKECSMYVIECPNVCGQYRPRGRLAEHLKDECELQIIPCPFAWVGCTIQVQRKVLDDHMRNDMQKHMEKLATSAYKNKQRMETLEGDNQSLKVNIALLQDEGRRASTQIQALKSKQEELEKVVNTLQYENDTLKHQVTKMFTESRAEQAVLARRSFSLESSIGLPPFSFIMDNMTKKLQLNTPFLSPPFYSHIGGYRLRIKVTPNGIFFGEGTHVSLTVYIMKGVFDDYLKWPFRGSVTVALLDQLDNVEHKTESITFDKGTSLKASGRVMKSDMNETGLVIYEFFDHAWLKPTSKKRKIYVKDDQILFKVVSVDTDRAAITP